ncbi:zinc-containing alcohol dehydrogenase superfamily protein [Polaribacter irgensii 23-P]|uniref:Zinc-containing alcohol dehydrogenase superfamily protein n=1 Tax=Polaribacter irgensii 23-P TaxID=313594 RepID=A4C0N5_9FLAO|nr:NADP-dependent oxidoreductase [Polaribacter irgensii]EAR12978.1 zinc-containing alcohol dehydrogenase superfamily protein [Polaribacter irgensii 23-P]
MKNKQIILKKRPVGFPDANTWELETQTVPELEEGEILIAHHYISLDPAMRGWMNDTKSYIPPVALNHVMRAGAIGKVIQNNNNPKFEIGDCVTSWGGVQQFSISNGDGWYKVDEKLASMPVYLGTLGMPGMTAYFGILEVGKIKAGDIVLVSGAAGAVGAIVGQIAKIKGCTVIGIAGGKEKCDALVNELGFDAAIDYKTENIYSALKKKCPKGIDVFFDNVGGVILDAALSKLRMHAKVVICGAISQYNNKHKINGPSNYLSLLVTRSTMQGMVVMDYTKDFGIAAKQMGIWMQEGKLKSKEDVYEGIENFQETYNRLFSGEKNGKLVLKVIE